MIGDGKNKEQERRMIYAISRIQGMGFNIIHQDETTLKFKFNGNEITIFPYTGWYSGKGIEDGRGINNLIKQLKQNK